jgi:Putative Flp pilus-assembly TadE/G-like
MTAQLAAKLRDETGAIAITVLLLFPSLMLLGVLAVDIGNWYVHKRELQIQADAGALAAAGYYKYPCDDAPISAVARNYAGLVSNRFDGSAEDRIPSANLTFLLNQPNFHDQSIPADTGMTGSPCADAAVDVKMTESQTPFLFGKSFVPHINAQARVSIRRLQGLKGMLPVALPVPDPKRVRVTFISEVTGETLGFKDLCARPDPVNGLNVWDNAASNTRGWNGTSSACDTTTAPTAKSLSFNDPAPDPTKGNKWNRVGVIVQMSGAADQIDCGQPLVSCYQSTSSGLGFIHGWSDQPAVTDAANSAPRPRSVVLLPGTCGDAYFNTQTATCTIGVSAGVDFQPREFGATGNVRRISAGGSQTVDAVSVSAIVGGTTYPLTWNSSAKRWTASNVSIAPSSGVSTVQLSWEQRDNTVSMSGVNQTCTTKNANPCKGTFADVLQRTVSANSTVAGPVKLLQIGDLTNTSGVDDVQECSSTKTTCGDAFVVTVGIGGTLALSLPTDPPSVLRVAGGSQTQAIDCDPTLNLKDEIGHGCGPAYGRNTGQACPDHAATATQPAGATWFCVWTQTGQSPSQISAGMNARVLGDEKANVCTAPNHWPDYQPDDPRIIPVFLVPFGTFSGSGNASYPVQDFAFFYITGWTGQGNGFNNPCQGNGDDPVPGNDAGLIVGHFIKHVDTLNVGGGGDEPCDLTTISGCVAVMTR